MKKVIIVGGGFGGMTAAKTLAKSKAVEITLFDQRNHHLFQPLLYQVAMAGLSPADIARPIRSMLTAYPSIRVLQCRVERIDKENRTLFCGLGTMHYDYLILACGARHSYFGRDGWEEYAPGLKNIEQATEIRRRVLLAYEQAEMVNDAALQKKLLTFVIVGGGPTGVELAGSIGEMSRFTLAKDFKNIDPALTRVILIEAGPRILPSFSEKLARRATRDLENLGVQVWTSSLVTDINANGVSIADERIQAATVLWAAGVQAADINQTLDSPLDKQGRVLVEADCSLKGFPEIFVIGDQAAFLHQTGNPLPGIAPVANQQGRFVAKTILNEIKELPRGTFRYRDKGQMATIGRSRAIAQIGKLNISGFLAWLAWLFVHIYFLTGFRNRLFVFLQWTWSYLTFSKGARLIIDKEWRLFPNKKTVPSMSAGEKNKINEESEEALARGRG